MSAAHCRPAACRLTFFAVLVFALPLLSACRAESRVTLRVQTPPQPSFVAFYRAPETLPPPACKTYSLPLPSETVGALKGVRFVRSDAARELLASQGFCAVPLGHFDVARALETVKDGGVPVFVGVDVVLFLYHVQFDELLKHIESTALYDDLVALCRAMVEASVAQQAKTSGDLRQAAEFNAAFFAVPLKLLDPAARIPASAAKLANAEIQLIEQHAGKMPSPLLGYEEDYSQYVPRGHYTTSERLRAYFKAMMWLGRATFPISEQMTRSRELAEKYLTRACLCAGTLGATSVNGTPALALWQRIYEPTAFFAGFADDLTPGEYAQAIREAVGSEEFDAARLLDPGVREAIREKLKTLRAPAIYGGQGPDYVANRPEELERLLAQSMGMRVMGQRYVPDSHVFQRLTYPSVGRYLGQGQPFTLAAGVRAFPRGLDFFAAAGNRRALELLRSEGDTAYQRYDEKLVEMQKLLSEIGVEGWHRALNWSWLYALALYARELSPGYPAFMLSEAWQDRQLCAALASWAHLRRDTILYAKQSYVGVTAFRPPAAPPPGYVEPRPDVYAELLALTAMTAKGLEALGLMDSAAQRSLEGFRQFLAQAKEIAQAELSGKPLSAEQRAWLRTVGSRVTALAKQMVRGERLNWDELMGTVADVHTDLNTQQVLEVGVGPLDMLFVVAPDPEGRPFLAAGPVLSFYEFKHPMRDRLTDEKWRQMLRKSPPPRPRWTSSYLAPR